jgi:hypothetical protein
MCVLRHQTARAAGPRALSDEVCMSGGIYAVLLLFRASLVPSFAVSPTLKRSCSLTQ